MGYGPQGSPACGSRHFCALNHERGLQKAIATTGHDCCKGPRDQRPCPLGVAPDIIPDSLSKRCGYWVERGIPGILSVGSGTNRRRKDEGHG